MIINKPQFLNMIPQTKLYAVVATHSDSVSGPTSLGTRSRLRTGALLVHNLNILEFAEWLAKSAWSACEEIS